jgi:cytochrome b561
MAVYDGGMAMRRYSMPSILLHWTMALAIGAA